MITAIASQKGGTGKTTTAISLAAALARKGKRTLLVDVDSQANASKVLLPSYTELTSHQTIYTTIIERRPLPVHPTSVPGLDIVPSHILLSNTDIELATAIDHREARLKSQLEKVKSEYDFVFRDCPPALSWLTINAFTASERAIIVISPGYFELDSLTQITKTIQRVREEFNPQIELWGLLFVMSDSTINTVTSLGVLRKIYPDKLFQTIIPRNTDIRDAHFNKKDIFAYNPHSKAGQAYARLIEEVFRV